MLTSKKLRDIISQAARAKERADLLENQWAARLAYLGSDLPFSEQPEWVQRSLPQTWLGYKSNAMTREWLPEVTPSEHKEILEHYPELAPWTRLTGSGIDQWMDFGPMIESKKPVIREIWVGARSLGCCDAEAPESGHEGSELTRVGLELRGMMKSQLSQEDSHELTHLMTLCPSSHEFKTRYAYLKSPKLGLMAMLYDDRTEGIPMMNDPETGELRPIEVGDSIFTVHGSNEDLDALFLEEGDDPRKQNDHEAYGSDHKFTDQYRANTSIETSFLTGNPALDNLEHGEPLPKLGPNIYTAKRDYVLASEYLPDDTRWAPDDLEIRRIAQQVAESLVKATPKKKHDLKKLTDHAEKEIRFYLKNVKWEDGALVQGHFVGRDEFFGTLEGFRMEYDEAVRRYETKPLPEAPGLTQPAHRNYMGVVTKAAPKAMDWQAIRTAHAKLLRQK